MTNKLRDNIEEIDANHFDVNKLLDRVKNNKEMFDQLILMVNQQLDQIMNEGYLLAEEGNLKNIKKFGHRLKGSAVTVCFLHLANLASQIELLETFEKRSFLELLSHVDVEIKYLKSLL